MNEKKLKAKQDLVEDTRKSNEENLRALLRITSDAHSSYAEKLRDILEFGRKVFGMEVGIFAKVQSEIYTIQEVIPSTGLLASGFSCDVCDTFCKEALASLGPFCIDNISKSEWRDHPGFTKFGREAYIGEVVWRNQKKFGALCFSSGQPRNSVFTSFEKDLLTLMTQWLGTEISRNLHHIELEERVQKRTTECHEIENSFRFLADSMPQIVWTALPDGNLDYYNNRWFEYTGMTLEQTKDWGWQPVLHPEDLQKSIQKWTASFTTGQDYEVEYRFKKASDGEYRWHLGRALPQRDEAGKIVKWFGTCTDIHDKKITEDSLRWSEQRYRFLLKASSDIIWTNNADGQMSGEQAAWGEFTGQSIYEYENYGWSDAIHPEDREQTIEKWKLAVKSQSIFIIEHRVRRHDGEYREFSVRAVPIVGANGEIREWVGAHTDITDKKLNAERALAQVSSDLRESELRYRSVAESANDAIISADALGNIISWNKSAESTFGYSEKEAIGLPLYVIMPERFQSHHEQGMRRMAAGAPSKLLNSTVELIGIRRNGVEFPIELSLSSWKSSVGQCFTGMIRDITDRKRVENNLESEARRRNAIIETQAAVAQAGLNFEKVLHLITTNAQSITGAEASVVEMAEGSEMVYTAASGTAENYVGLRLDINTSLSGLCVISHAIQRCDDAEVDPRVDNKACRRLGVRSMVIVPLENAGRTIGALKVCSSKLNAFSDADQHALVLMANMVGASLAQIQSFEERKKLSDQICLSNEELQSATRAKSQFLANMSHEIRTPLSSIIGFTQMLLSDEMSADERDKALHTVLMNGQHLLGVTNDILDLSKIEAGKLEIEQIPTSLFDLVSDVGNLMTHKAADAEISFGFEYNFPLPTVIRTDPTRLKQILFNLIGNAIKFTKKGEVKVNINFNHVNELLSFAVVDTGIGIPLEHQRRLFQAFTQADASTTREFGGTGLGLVISAQLADKLGGKISLESAPGVGSKFTLTIATGPVLATALTKELPLTRSEKPTLEAIRLDLSDLCGDVLIAEDGPDNRNLITFLLRKTQIRATMVENGALAIEAAANAHFDLILMDMQMPVMDGYTATTMLRSKGFEKPIIALTANVMTTDIERTLSAGCTAHLGKPFERNNFYELLHKYLSSKKSDHTTPLELSEDIDFSEISKQFLAGLSSRISSIRSAADVGDLPEVSRLAHMLASAGMFGFENLGTLASILENTANQKRDDEVERLLSNLYSMSDSLLSENTLE